MGQSDRTADLVNQLIREHGSTLEHVVTQIVHDSDTARQILQDTYVQLHKRLLDNSVPPVLYPRAYLFKAAYNRAWDYLRRQARRASTTQFIVDEEGARRVPDPAPGPEKTAILTEAMLSLSHILESLSRNQRDVFVLGKVDGVPRRDIAAQLSLSEVAVDRLMTRALAALRKGLIERGLDPGVLGVDDGEPEPK